MKQFVNQDLYLATVCKLRCPPPRPKCGRICPNNEQLTFVCCKDGKKISFSTDCNHSEISFCIDKPLR